MNNSQKFSDSDFDRFPTNICESFRPINRNPVYFEFTNIEVWRMGQCIFRKETTGLLVGKLIGQKIEFTLKNTDLKPYLLDSFTFEEISTTSNRIIWSKDLMNSMNLRYSDFYPELVSLFFVSNKLVKAAFNIHNQDNMVELF